MSWAKFDDRYDDNRKVKKAWRANGKAIGLHCMAITYSARHETDGLIDIEWLVEKLPNGKERETVIRVLVDAGLFEVVDGELFQVHDYLDFNLSSEKLTAKRLKDAARKRDALLAESSRSPNGVANSAAGIPS